MSFGQLSGTYLKRYRLSLCHLLNSQKIGPLNIQLLAALLQQ